MHICHKCNKIMHLFHWEQPQTLTYDKFSLLAQIPGFLADILEVTRWKGVEIALRVTWQVMEREKKLKAHKIRYKNGKGNCNLNYDLLWG